jgi:hypothetical protein
VFWQLDVRVERQEVFWQLDVRIERQEVVWVPARFPGTPRA